VQVLRLRPHAGQVSLLAAPLKLTAPADERYRHLRVVQGRLQWQALPAAQALARRVPPAPVSLTDRHGTALWSGGAPGGVAHDAGLAPLLGLNEDHTNSIAGMLGRLGGQPHAGRLSLDLPLQQLAHRVLDCVGLRQGRWVDGRCSGARPVPQGRQAGLVILDAEEGDVLAAAGAGGVAVTARSWAEARDFDRANPARSPLRLPALQHDGGIHRSPGSTFKIVSALGLELAAQKDKQLDSLLAGLPLAGLNDAARAGGFAFQTAAGTYPVNTRAAHITNFRDQHLDRKAEGGRFGLPQALTYSLNTWFAWTAELSDHTLLGRPDGGLPGVRSLDPQALAGVRPIAAMAQRLGFGRPLRLDGGLLPEDFAWSDWDALQASPSRIDPIDTRHEVRQMAIGLRMQTTPLQMALAAGAVGQSAVVAPRLLLELDGRDAPTPKPEPIGVRLDRVRAGLKGVIDAGTAASAFRDPALAAVRKGLYGKTGTAPTSDDGRSTVWFTGWLEPGSLPGQRHRLAFAVFVSHSDVTGGEHAAPVVAAVLRDLQKQKGN
jgi:cell division protein FtsI/penicillin-binding protein 2